jgi:hypothetical protein
MGSLVQFAITSVGSEHLPSDKKKGKNTRQQAFAYKYESAGTLLE